jgi:hypothetical protein
MSLLPGDPSLAADAAKSEQGDRQNGANAREALWNRELRLADDLH